MALSIKVFGLSSWSLLVPQALEGVAAVGLLHATVRRTTGSAAAGLIAGVVLATTPVAVLMFRFDNPDALLTLLLVGSAYAALRAVESDVARGGHPVRWLALAGTLVGLAFLTKMLQAFLVIPALGLVYLLFAHTSFLKRIGHLMVGLGAMVASAGWWVAIVSLWPAGSRPYIGGSQDDSILELTLGYNGFGRLTGDEVGSVGGGGAGANGGRWGETGLGRLLGDEIGGQVGWLLPAALVLLVAGLWLTRRATRTDPVRASLVIWGGWLLVTAATFSFMAGIFHAYYTVALAPAIGALVGTGAWLLWQPPHLAPRRRRGERDRVADDRARLLPARPDPGFPAVAAVGGAVRRPRRGAGRRRPRPAAAADRGRARRGRRPGLAGRPHGLRRRHRGHAAHRLDPERGAGHRGRLRWWGSGRDADGHAARRPAAGCRCTDRRGSGRGHGRWCRRAAQRQRAHRRDHRAAPGGRGRLHLGRRRRRLQLGVRLSVGQRGAGDGDRRLQRLRPLTDARGVPGLRRGWRHPLLHRRRCGGGFGGNQMGGSSASNEIAAWVAENFTATTVDGVTLYDLATGAAS